MNGCALNLFASFKVWFLYVLNVSNDTTAYSLTLFHNYSVNNYSFQYKTMIGLYHGMEAVLIINWNKALEISSWW